MKTFDVMKKKIIDLFNKGFFHIFGSSSINKILSFLSTFILVRVLTKYDYGIYSYALNLYSLFYLVNGLGLSSATLQLCSEKETEESKPEAIISYGFKVTVFVNILVGIILFGYSCIADNKINGSGELIVLFAILIPLTSIYELIQIYFRYNFENKKFSYYTTINSLLVLGLSIFGAVVSSSKGLCVGRIVGYILTIVSGIVVFKFPLAAIKCTDKIGKKLKKTMFLIGSISMLNIATGQLLNLIDVTVVANVLADSVEIASYKVATIVPDALLFIPASLMIYYFPIFTRNKDDIAWVKHSYHKILAWFGAFNFFIVATYLAFSGFFVRFVFGAQYDSSISISNILILAYFFSATFRKITGNILVTQRKLTVNLVIGILEVGFNFLFNYIFVTRIGAIGAAYATLAISIMSAIGSFIYFESYLKKKFVLYTSVDN